MKHSPLKKSLISLMTISSVFINTAFAEEEALHLQKGTPAPYSGVLLSVEKATEVRQNLIELKTLRAINDSYVKSVQLYEESIQLNNQKNKLLLDRNEKLTEELGQIRSSSDFQKILWFSLGVLASGFAVYGAKKIAQ